MPAGSIRGLLQSVVRAAARFEAAGIYSKDGLIKKAKEPLFVSSIRTG
jgi:hypothetical protein